MNRKSVISLFVSLIVALIAVGSVIAQEPPPATTMTASALAGTAITYQGQLQHSDAPANLTCNFKFSIWDAVSNGSSLSSEQTINSVEVVNGHFTVQVDFGTPFTTPMPWLQTAIQCNGDTSYTTLAPRQKLSALTITEGGQIGVGTTSPESTLHVAGDVLMQAGAKKLYLSSGGAVDIMTPTNSLFIASRAIGPCPYECNNVLINPWAENGNVGIGTIGPQAKLHVAGSTRVDGWLQADHFAMAGTDFRMLPNARGNGGLALVHDANNTLVLNFGQEFTGGTRVDGSLSIGGRTRTSVLEITGGSDLAELFSQADGTLVEPGTVMVIDPEHAGKLKVSTSAYDRKVAGIISGAGDVNPGLTLQQEGVLDGNLPVAIAGRVYVKAEALSGAIEPGDLLTTSDMVGYAMKATNDELSHGAIIGKAMTGLDEGMGLVLVLVNLQ
jgi:hypothetical protein